MDKFSLKTILTTAIGASIAGSLIALPVKANEDLFGHTGNSEILSQIDYSDRFSYAERNRTNSEPSDDFKNIVGLTGLAIGTGVVGYHLTRAYRPSLANSPTFNNNNSSSGGSLLTSVSPKLRRELLRLVHNQQTANRLLSGTLNSHPGRSANWLAEKVIYDLKRDR